MGKRLNSKLGDKRLEKGFEALLNSMLIHYSVILRQLATGRGEEVQLGRFVNNPKVTSKGLVDHCCEQLGVDVKGRPVLVINDTSTISFAPNARREELGFVGPNSTKSGFDVHPAIVLDGENGACYGLGGISIYKTEFARTEQEQADQAQRRRDKWKTPFEEKERYKWFDAPRQAIANYADASSYTLIGDREADIYDLMGLGLQQQWDFVYRSRTNRLLSTPSHGQTKLYQAIEQWPVAHTYELDLPGTKKRTAHQAIIDLKFGSVAIAKPESCRNTDLSDQIDLWVVQAKERSQTIVGKEKPVHWILLTSHPVQNTEQALQIVQWYLWRWTIEQLFRTLKSKGLNVEKAEVESFHGLVNLATMALIAAVQVMQLVQARDGQTLQRIGDAFFEPEIQCLTALNTKVEGKTQKQKNPHPPNTLSFAAWIIARLGGWSGYQKDKPPGPITFIRGLNRFYNILEGYYLFR
ncbi:IS4 family transposase [Flavilitoribacter nigricans]|uniref:Transposase IS4-like domain-containing protein n=1 Tax=Flavilitoribacter nigricans (strain ATCC 23147 / DSM 23189 / NBRC 102662 / NCIMB 1420 / SS-2) TaxID=1122177 RepID=A0A2D0N1C4_FLAN2|nr:IS4 family transposase [Flavilitoribacter nigricans]PHN02166.1 hypothetical protein CRP01_33800 [Flavilitoribacter nigricans DSM 23189 = NBRC 102662]